MPTVSSKRQVTLPKELCDRLGVDPGDEVDILEHNGRITVLKKVKGASAGVLKHIKADTRFTDDDSLQSELDKRQLSRKTKGRAA